MDGPSQDVFAEVEAPETGIPLHTEASIRADWREFNERWSDRLNQVIEVYPAGDTAELARALDRDGLLYLINREVLCPLGYALEFPWVAGRRSVLAIHYQPGIELAPFDHLEGQRKLNRAGIQ